MHIVYLSSKINAINEREIGQSSRVVRYYFVFFSGFFSLWRKSWLVYFKLGGNRPRSRKHPLRHNDLDYCRDLASKVITPTSFSRNESSTN